MGTPPAYGRVRLARLALAGACLCGAAAGPAALAADLSMTIAVTPTRGERSIADTPGRIEVVAGGELETLPGASLDEKLSATSPGLSSSRNNGIYSFSSVLTMRGLPGGEQGRTLILLDGAPINTGASGAVNWNRLSYATIDRIEVFKGPGSSLYGAGAAGGVVNVITRAPSGRALSASYGTYRTFDYRGEAGIKAGKLALSVSGGYLTSSGYISAPRALRDPYTAKKYVRERTAAMDSAIDLGDAGGLRLQYSHNDGLRGEGSRIFTADGVSRNFRTHSGRAAWSGERDGIAWQAAANYQREDYFRLNEYFRGASYYRVDTHGIRSDAGAQTSLSLRGPGGFDPTFGLDYRRGMVDAADLQTRPSLSYARDQGRMDIFAPYAQVVKEVSGVRLQAGLRYDNAYFHNGYYSNTSPGWGPANGPLDTHKWESFSPRLSAGWDYAEGFSQYVSYGRSFRAPPLEDMCLSLMRGSGSAARFTMANPRLRPEKVGTAETGFRMNPVRGVYLDPGAYVSLGEDFIYEINTGEAILINGTSTPVYKKWNVSRVKIYGAEVPLRSVFGPVTVSASYGWSESRILRFPYNTALRRKSLTYAPRHLLSLGMEYRSGTSSAGAEWRYKSRQYADDANTAGLGGYGTLSLSASRRLSKTISARIRADNVLDERYTESLTDMAPGRTVTATIEAGF